MLLPYFDANGNYQSFSVPISQNYYNAGIWRGTDGILLSDGEWKTWLFTYAVDMWNTLYGQDSVITPVPTFGTGSSGVLNFPFNAPGILT
jgi:hypothetical protein